MSTAPVAAVAIAANTSAAAETNTTHLGIALEAWGGDAALRELQHRALETGLHLVKVRDDPAVCRTAHGAKRQRAREVALPRQHDGVCVPHHTHKGVGLLGGLCARKQPLNKGEGGGTKKHRAPGTKTRK